MATRIYDPLLLTAQGALIDLTALESQRGKQSNAILTFTRPRLLYLRWQTSPAVGLPTEPFRIWRRPAFALGNEEPVAFELLNLGFAEVIQFEAPLASVSLTVKSSAGGTMILGLLCGPPELGSLVALQTRTFPSGGTDSIQFHAPRITGIMLINVSSFSAVTGMTVAALEKVELWRLVETVGLPVAEAEWMPLRQRHGVKQGLAGAEKDPIDAAVERFARGVNPLGWWPAFPNGAPAPLWEIPDPARLVEESAIELLPMLRAAAQLPPDQQAQKLFHFTINPPQNPDGVPMTTADPGGADLSPIKLLAMTAATDPQLAVTLGYGTGYLEENIPTFEIGDRPVFGDPLRSDWDWLVTGLWEKGFDGESDAIELAALVPRPAFGLPSPTPADLHVDLQACLRPAAADQPWIASVRTSWERFPLNQIANVASFASARHADGSAAPALALLERRALTGGHRPIGNMRNRLDPEPVRQSATDGALTIPNDPGSVAITYGAATQTIFGIWSPWATGPVNVVQPGPAVVPILSATLDPTDTGSGTLCPATLVIEISVDWRIRSVRRVELRGRLFPSASRGEPAPLVAAPAGLQKMLGGAAGPVRVDFLADVPLFAGGTVEALNEEGTAVVTPGVAQGTSRRYRITIPGFSLDYASTPHIGLLLEARLVEQIVPQRVGPWSPAPRLAYASDPRARPTNVVDIVQLASLPDAAGECHAHIAWAAVPGASGYALYESTETRILSSHPGLLQPTPDRTLSQRLTTIKQAFAAAPLRRDFVRRNAQLIAATEADVALPRGSRDIHLYTILPVMAGGSEGPWPSGPDADEALTPYAAPRVAEPAPPTLEVQLVSDKPPAPPNYRARLRVGVRSGAGAPVKRVDLYRVRVDDAARAVDSMGPPIASLTGSDGGWVVAPTSGGDSIATVTGYDQPAGSWRTIWYRAIAWSEDDPLRGVLKGRSEPSPAASVLVPPPGPPDLSPITISWPGGDPAAVLLSFTSAAPVPPTPLGPHKLSVEALVVGAGPLVRQTETLLALPEVQPGIASGVWRQGGAPTRYRLLLHRAAVDDVVSVIVRLSDPIGRTSEQTVIVAAGPVMPLPKLSPIGMFPSGADKVYAFTTNAPNSDGAGGSFRLHVELTPVPSAPVLKLPSGPPGSILGPVAVRSQFKRIGGVYVFDGKLASVPRFFLPTGPSGVRLAIGRHASPTDDDFAIFAGIKLRSVLVRIVTPDGRTVERQRRG